jgi:hypothetical protein
MSQTVQRQTNQMPAWLMSSGAVVGNVGATLKKHAQKIPELVGLVRRPPQTARGAALTGRTRSSQRWEQATDWPLMVAAVVFLAAYAVPVLAPDLPAWLLDLCRWLIWITWGIFVVDIAVRLALTDGRLRYLVRHWYDVLVIALPLLRPLRLLRLIPLLSVLNRRAKVRLRGRLQSTWPVAPSFWPSAPPQPYSTPSGPAPTPTSPTSAMRSGGRVALWPLSVTATATRLLVSGAWWASR